MKKSPSIFIFAALSAILPPILLFRLTDLSPTIVTFGFSEASSLILHRWANAVFLLQRDWTSYVIVSLGWAIVGVGLNDSLPLIAVFSLGLFALLRRTLSPAKAALLSVLTAATLGLALRLDLLLLRTFAWLPLLCAMLLRLKTSSTPSKKYPCILLSLLSAQHGNFLAIVPASIAAVFLKAQALPLSASIIALLFLPALLFSRISPIAPVPNYPPSSHVMEDDGLLGIVQPLIGVDQVLQLWSRQLPARFILPLIFSLGFFAATYWLCARSKARLHFRAQPVLFNLALGLIFLCFLDSCIPEKYALIMPLSVLSQNFPGLQPYPLSFLALSSAFLFLQLSIPPLWPRILLCLCLALASLFSSSVPEFPGPQSPTLAEINQSLAMETTRARLLSPSYAVYAAEGLFYLKPPSGQLNSQSPSAFSCSGTSSSGDTHTSLAFDGDLATRWSSASAGQFGNEWYQLDCSAQAGLPKVRGLELRVGRYFTDFPRGLRIRACNSPAVIYENHSWQGAVEHTTDGFAYYGGQSTVRVLFAEPQQLNCLRLEQISVYKHFDWSIAEMFLILAEPF